MSVRFPLHRAAAVMILVLGGYLEIVEWLDLEPWTTSFAITHGDNGQQTLDVIVGGILIALAAALWFLRSRIVALVSSVLLGLWMWLQIQTWWMPYFYGASRQWAKTYAKWFAKTVQILPSSPGHLPPDANHFVLQILVLVTLVLCISVVFQRSSPRDE